MKNRQTIGKMLIFGLVMLLFIGTFLNGVSAAIVGGGVGGIRGKIIAIEYNAQGQAVAFTICNSNISKAIYIKNPNDSLTKVLQDAMNNDNTVFVTYDENSYLTSITVEKKVQPSAPETPCPPNP